MDLPAPTEPAQDAGQPPARSAYASRPPHTAGGECGRCGLVHSAADAATLTQAERDMDDLPPGLQTLASAVVSAVMPVAQAALTALAAMLRTANSGEPAALAAARAAFTDAAAAVWREIDRLDSRPGGYRSAEMDVVLRRRERAAWERYRALLPGGLDEVAEAPGDGGGV